MAFVSEDGSGLSNANSQISVAVADAFHGDRGNADWTSLNATEKQQLLIKATDYFIETYSFSGSKLVSTQTMPFPTVEDGFPQAVQNAVAELALFAKTETLNKVFKRSKKSVKLGPLAVEYDGSSESAAFFSSVAKKLEPFLASEGASFCAKIVRT